jgi:hypothetical protein
LAQFWPAILHWSVAVSERFPTSQAAGFGKKKN